MFRTVAFASTFLICNLSFLSAALSQHSVAAITGNELFRYCETSATDFDRGFCEGFVAGTWNDLVAAREQRFFCDPPNATFEHVTEVVQTYLARHPEKLHQDATTLIFHALDDAFPCPW